MWSEAAAMNMRLQLIFFDVLRHFDHIDVDIILSEGFAEDSFGQAVMNRLIKAAGHHIENVE